MGKQNDLTQYYKCQTDICFNSQLYGENIEEHGSKILMLFAEVYAFLVEEFGLNLTPRMIILYENTENFKSWFWKVKHRLGIELKKDPDFCQIGKWIGNGFFMRIIISIVEHSKKEIKEHRNDFNFSLFYQSLINKQLSLLNNLKKDNFFENTTTKALYCYEDSFVLLQERTVLNCLDPFFIKSNSI